MEDFTKEGLVVVGVLGGIASGKSVVARLLAGETGVVLDADALAHEALADPDLAARVGAELGAALVDDQGRVDRAALARRAFSEPEVRTRLEDWIHPLVRGKILAGLTDARDRGRGPAVLDVPLLLENEREHGLTGLCDFLVFVAVDAARRDRRAVRRRGWEPGEVARRENTQMPLEEKMARAHHVITNESGLDELAERVREVLAAEGLG
ncbi:MAG: dephospho-CoA kinase [Planctomycetota bacterium]|jgi:dephospho-CoA kinase|nr:dephospho-CoA kinase [Planctomycetota bacterium]MDP6989506.1 dephospho-CoA kinase [Planctomycetota bacterium]